MKLTRIRIEQLRQFRAPFELAGLDEGLNLFTGPNEAGKSTVVRAIRAAFFERHRSSSVDDLQPFGDPSASPGIEIDFETAGQSWRLRKSFLQRKRCQLVVGAQQLDGEEAEQRLAQLLGFEFSLRGASKPEHWGIPGLLWIEQGTGHAIHAAVGHATQHLQRALDQSVGEVASTQGDDIASRVQAERDALLTAAGKPRQAYADALTQRDALRTEALTLDAQIESYRRHVDELALLQAADEADRAARPWEAFEAQLALARQASTEAQGLAARRGEAIDALRRDDEHVALIEQQLQAFDRQEQALGQREAALREAQEALAGHAAARERHRQERDAAAASYEAAVLAVARARQENWRAELAGLQAEAARQAAALTLRLADARAEAAQLGALRTQAAAHAMPEGVMPQLRKQQARCDELRIRQEGRATRLRFSFVDQGRHPTLDGDALAGEGERLLAGPARLEIPGHGHVDIVPGQSDAPQAARELAEQRADFEARLKRLGVTTLDEAEARDARHRQALAGCELAERALALLAPQGLDALEAALAEQRARESDAARQALQLPPAAGSGELATFAEAEAAQQLARKLLDQIEAKAEASRSAFATAQARHDLAQRERDSAAAVLSEPGRTDAMGVAAGRLAEARARRQLRTDEVARLDHELGAARPDILAQDVLRLERTVAQARRTHAERQSQIASLRGNLEATGALGLEEARGELAARLQAAQRRADELAQRAEALQLVHGLIDTRRRAATRRLRAPLQARIQHYLQLLFPDAVLDIGDDLSPGALIRGGVQGARPGEAGGAQAAFDSLSFGAREQMALISRLAYADLLKAAGRPTLVILDDALVHSDEQRLVQMKRVLFDASQRHQVLLFTCHPQHWRDLGAMPRPIGSAG